MLFKNFPFEKLKKGKYEGIMNRGDLPWNSFKENLGRVLERDTSWWHEIHNIISNGQNETRIFGII